MKFFVEIDIMPLKALLDPQGKAVTNSMHNIGFAGVDNVRIGKHVTLEITAKDQKQAVQITEEACKTMLSNPIMESYEFRIKQLEK